MEKVKEDQLKEDVETETEPEAKLSKELSKVDSSHSILSSASKILRKKIPSQSRLLMTPKRLWMQTISTQDCEVVILFNRKTGEATVNWLACCLRSRLPELVFSIKNHRGTGSFAFYVTATVEGFLKGAIELKMKKKLKEEFGSGWKEITHEEMHLFQGVEELISFFSSEERQRIVLHLLNSMRALEGDSVGSVVLRPGQTIVAVCLSRRILIQIMPLHDHSRLANLRISWVQSFFSYQPLDTIQEYFGAKIGIYFAWLGFYTTSLLVPATFGLFIWLKFCGRDQATEDKAFVLLAFLNVIWGSSWLEAWKRQSAVHTYRWGLENQSPFLDEPRPQFFGELRRNDITGRVEPFYPRWKRNAFRCFISVPIVIVCLFLVLISMLLMLHMQDWWDSMLKSRELPDLLSYMPKFLMAISITLFDEGYIRVAVWLNEKENHRNSNTYDNNLIVKLAVFRLVNSFLALFYIAFYLQEMETLKEQLVALFVTRQIVGNIKESCIPYLVEQFKLAKLSFDVYGGITPSEPTKVQKTEIDMSLAADERDCQNHELPTNYDGNKKDEHQRGEFLEINNTKSRILEQAEIESNMAKYDDTLEDYLEMFIQFGYVMLFSSAFPLAATCAFVNNLIEIRSDAFKLCSVFQRPFGQRVSCIGVWQDAMEFMCILGIMVNCIMIGLSGQVQRMFPEMSTTQTVLLIVVLEHLMLALKYTISYLIPNVPQNVANEFARMEFYRRETLRQISLSTSKNVSEQSTSKCQPELNYSSVECVERGVQTEVITKINRKSTSERKERRERYSLQREKSIEVSDASPKKKLIKNINLGRSVSAGEKVRHLAPKGRQNHVGRWQWASFDLGSNEAYSESMPHISQIISDNSKSRTLLHDMAEQDKPAIYDRFENFNSLPSESILEHTIKEENCSSNNLTNPDKTANDLKLYDKKTNQFATTNTTERQSVTSLRSLSPSTMHNAFKEENVSASNREEEAKAEKRHPGKFLKRAQSFTQVFRKIADKRKKAEDALQENFRSANEKPLGELSLVPLEKLISIDDFQKDEL